ncbi:MAG: helix-turn-helix domain-containing protein [Eubacteriales bacterium]
MKPQELKQEYIRLRAEGRSYSYIADKLHISKSTCTKWEKALGADIAQLKREELNTLYDAYHMKKEDRIKKLGETLEKVEEALGAVDLQEVAPEKLLDFKLKYTEALQKEYVGTEPAFKFSDTIDPTDIVKALGDLLNRVRAGEVTTEQASKESIILSNLLKAYETVEVKAKLDELEAIVGGR